MTELKKMERHLAQKELPHKDAQCTPEDI